MTEIKDFHLSRHFQYTNAPLFYILYAYTFVIRCYSFPYKSIYQSFFSIDIYIFFL